MAIKGIAAGAGAKDMKKMFSDLNITGFGKSKWGHAQKDVNKQFEQMGDELSSPFEAVLKSVMSDVVGGKMGETFGEAFKGKGTDMSAGATPGAGTGPMPFSATDEMFGEGIDAATGITGTSASVASTPWKDQFLGQFGLGEDSEFNMKIYLGQDNLKGLWIFLASGD